MAIQGGQGSTASSAAAATPAAGRIFIINLQTLERREAQYIPNRLIWDRKVQEGDIVVAGRNHPVYHYITGQENLKIRFDYTPTEETRRDALEKFLWIKSLTYNDGFKRPRPRVRIVFGDIFKKEIWVVDSVEGDLSLFNKAASLLPGLVYIDVNFKLDPRQNVHISDVR